ncbi:hypothetical protein T02_13587 [Trichinella nativa]|uniref:Uncharacterized protein n=1 Tax=Trichinella nativa TaxID=6335 RepID=A0A0V1LKT9_9BILA|nr:hypothetical protein T06_14408 [Trichinella sp. T6]KRZ59964.1 hypothetical protein T02_13587 [Trichinella nativa]
MKNCCQHYVGIWEIWEKIFGKCDKCAPVDEYECDINLSQVKWGTFCTPLLFLADISAALLRFRPDFSK